MKFKIVAPSTSANLGPGFDCLGIALSLYNDFYFEKVEDKFEFVDMEEKYSNNDNLVVKSSLITYEYLGVKPIYYKLKITSRIPKARGLGSSATCIVSGIIAAGILSNKKLTDDEIIKIGTMIEGHPDNIAPCVLGMCVASVNADKILYHKHYVEKKLHFTVVIPSEAVKTIDARNVLPKSLPYSDFIYSMSRAILIPKALSKANIEYLYELLNDKIHQPYRFKLIKESEKFIEFSKENKIPFCISGSGSCMLYITNESITNKLINISNNVKIKELKVDRKGVRIYEK